MHDHSVGRPMKVREQRKHRVNEKSSRKLSSELLALTIEIPVHLFRAAVLPSRRKRHRRRDKHSGRLVKLKTCSTRFPVDSLHGIGAVYHLLSSRHSLEPDGAWLVPVVGPEELYHCRRLCSDRPRQHGVILENLRPLCRALRTINTLAPPAPVSFGLAVASSPSPYPISPSWLLLSRLVISISETLLALLSKRKGIMDLINWSLNTIDTIFSTRSLGSGEPNCPV
ncbi:hypothetical protein QQF64_012125 [Cirrhinus molitorella]|uniref:Uncharacterized protein n=1 Tax=Cirrhinus molitorella TaxID=172907 RepID=A0ABR3LUJ3_9TELE